jgi:hypothetical protein
MENVDREREREREEGESKKEKERWVLLKKKKKKGIYKQPHFAKFSKESETNPTFHKHCGGEEEERSLPIQGHRACNFQRVVTGIGQNLCLVFFFSFFL